MNAQNEKGCTDVAASGQPVSNCEPDTTIVATSPKTSYMSPPQLAKLWRCKSEKVLTFIKTGQLEAVDLSLRPGVGRPRWKITPESVKRFEAARSNRTAARSAPRKYARRQKPSIPQYV